MLLIPELSQGIQHPKFVTFLILEFWDRLSCFSRLLLSYINFKVIQYEVNVFKNKR